MKKLSKISNNIISLSNLSESCKDKLSNLDGYEINECCGCCCDCSANTCCEPCTVSSDQICYFYSEREIVNKIKQKVQVSDIIHIHEQFNRFKFVSTVGDIEPLYFKDRLSDEIMQQLPAGYNTYNSSEDVYSFIKELCTTYNMQYPVCVTNLKNTLSLYFLKFNGSNGEECSIKSSLEEVAQLLGELEKNKKIQRAQVLDVSIDDMDDTYAYVVTVECDPMKIVKSTSIIKSIK